MGFIWGLFSPKQTPREQNLAKEETLKALKYQGFLKTTKIRQKKLRKVYTYMSPEILIERMRYKLTLFTKNTETLKTLRILNFDFLQITKSQPLAKSKNQGLFANNTSQFPVMGIFVFANGIVDLCMHMHKRTTPFSIII